MGIYLLLGTVAWLYVLSVLKRSRLSAFYFIVGSAGLFFVLTAISNPYWVWFFTHAVIHGVNVLGHLTGWCSVTTKTGLVFITNAANPVTMSIDYECSGIIETCALVALLAFFPTYAKREKVFYVVFGIIFIYLANVIRLMTVVIMVHFGGGDMFFLAHSIVGRLVFYLLVIILYYNVFTYSQLARGIYREFADRGGKTE